MKRALVRHLGLSLLLLGLGGCALSDEPGREPAGLDQGLTVLEASDSAIYLAYRKQDAVIFMSALIGKPTPAEYRQSPTSPRFEVDARFDADNGRTFYSRKGGDHWIDPTWPGDFARQSELPPTRVSNESLFRLSAEATEAMEAEIEGLLGVERARALEPALRALREFGEKAVETYAADRMKLDAHLDGRGLTPEQVRGDEVAYGTPGPEDSDSHLFGANYYYIAVHDVGIYWSIGRHSATRLHQWLGYWAWLHDSCNHGDCAGSMGQKCTLQYYVPGANVRSAWFFQNCGTSYDWDSEDGGHNCHDDTRLQLHNYVYGSYNNGRQGWCNDGDSSTDISVDIWGIELDQDGSPECNASTNKGYNHPSWSQSGAYVCQPGGDRLCPGESLGPGQFRKSADGRFTLVYQGDGNLVLYRWDGYPLWSAASNSAPGAATMQGDGNLVVYNSSWSARWSSNTWAPGYPGYWLVVQNDGNVVMYNPAWGARWSTNTWGY